MRVVSAVSFFTPTEIEQLALKTGVLLSSTSAKRQGQVLGFLQALSSRIGFPQRTTATAQLFYLRFHLFYSPNDFIPHEVAIACLVVAAKVNDTPKKSREIILSSWALRYPELVRSVPLAKSTPYNGSSNTVETGLKSICPASVTGLGVISESDIDIAALDTERKRILSLESLILQSIAFEFNVRSSDNLLYTVKLAKRWKVEKEVGRLAWQVAADSHRTYAPLSFPPSTIAAASLYTASLLSLRCNRPSAGAVDMMRRFELAGQSTSRQQQEWEVMLCCTIDSVEDVVHSLLDLYGSAIAALPTSSTSTHMTPISPATPASPSEAISTDSMLLDARNLSPYRKLPSLVYSPPPFGVLHLRNCGISATNADLLNDLTQMKIALRRLEESRADKGVCEEARTARVFDTGGIRGDAERETDEEVEKVWQERAKEKLYSALQRFLF
ncbi:hypothetical protein CBS101457_001082 [Exobasidium rhododendri]|nr:hypothetical protein CBS101457_001082 [Exobasidium rhododendri]